MAEFVSVAAVEDIAVGKPNQVIVGEYEIAVYNLGGEFYATSDVCTHDQAYLSDGEVFGTIVECPLHGARFDVRTGKALTLPAVYPVKRYETRVVDGRVEVKIEENAR